MFSGLRTSTRKLDYGLEKSNSYKFDAWGHFIRRLRDYDRQGEILPEGQMGRLSLIRRDHVDYEPRFQGLTTRDIEKIVARDLGRALVLLGGRTCYENCMAVRAVGE